MAATARAAPLWAPAASGCYPGRRDAGWQQGPPSRSGSVGGTADAPSLRVRSGRGPVRRRERASLVSTAASKGSGFAPPSPATSPSRRKEAGEEEADATAERSARAEGPPPSDALIDVAPLSPLASTADDASAAPGGASGGLSSSARPPLSGPVGPLSGSSSGGGQPEKHWPPQVAALLRALGALRAAITHLPGHLVAAVAAARDFLLARWCAWACRLPPSLHAVACFPDVKQGGHSDPQDRPSPAAPGLRPLGHATAPLSYL